MTRRYRLGMALARLGDVVVSQIALRDVAMPVMRDLTALTGLDIEKSNPGKAMGLDSYDADKLASDRFQASYDEDGMNKRIEELKPAEEKEPVGAAAQPGSATTPAPQ